MRKRQGLTPQERALLRAKPCEEKDKSKVDWGEQVLVILPVEEHLEKNAKSRRS
jgi:hypothetical protein